MNENQQQTEPINSVACEFWTQKTGYNKRPQSFLGSFTFIVPPTDPLTFPIIKSYQFLSRFEHGQLILYWQYEHPGSDEILCVTLVRLFNRKMSLVPPPLSIRCLSRSTSSSSFCTGLSDTLTRLAKWEWNVSNYFKSARSAQSVKRLTAEREVASSIPGVGPILRVWNNWEWKVLPLLCKWLDLRVAGVTK